MPITVLVVISPKQGKEERCRNLMAWVSNEVKENEPDTSAYACFSEEGDVESCLDFYVYFEYDLFFSYSHVRPAMDSTLIR